MKTLNDAVTYGKFLVGLRGFLEREMDYDEAAAVVRHRLENREAMFLDVLKTRYLNAAHSPYPALFRHAGCEFGDVSEGVQRDGLEPTLKALLEAGVYLTFEEFKGREPLVRGGREIQTGPEAFENKRLEKYYHLTTGGSTGAARKIAVDLEHMWGQVPNQRVVDTIQGLVGPPLALWFDGLPGNGLNAVIARVPSGIRAERWFCPTIGRDSRPALKFRLAQAGIMAVSRLAMDLPRPELVRLSEPEVIVRWAEDALRRRGRAVLRTFVSRGLRVCFAARQMGVDLTGLTIAGGGESPTPAKVEGIRASGASFVSNYASQELGAIGHMCMTSDIANDQHLMSHHLAMVTRQRKVPGFDRHVDSLCYTSLLPSTRKLMLNVETDDYGVVDERSCGCPYEDLGLTTHIRGVYSFQKLTGEGMTLVGNELDTLIEETLPARFGGSAIDYQFHENEDHRGFTRISVVVSPRLGAVDEASLIATVLEGLGAASHAGDISRVIWQQAGSLRVRREEPTWTRRGKLMPLHLDRTEPHRPGQVERRPTKT